MISRPLLYPDTTFLVLQDFIYNLPTLGEVPANVTEEYLGKLINEWYTKCGKEFVS